MKVSGSASAQEKGPLTAGQMAPAFHAADQNGKKEHFSKQRTRTTSRRTICF